MAINWGILDTGNIKVETPDLFGAAQRGFKFGQSLGEFAALPQLRGAVQNEAQYLKSGGESIGALAQVDPAAAFNALTAQRNLEGRAVEENTLGLASPLIRDHNAKAFRVASLLDEYRTSKDEAKLEEAKLLSGEIGELQGQIAQYGVPNIGQLLTKTKGLFDQLALFREEERKEKGIGFQEAAAIRAEEAAKRAEKEFNTRTYQWQKSFELDEKKFVEQTKDNAIAREEKYNAAIASAPAIVAANTIEQFTGSIEGLYDGYLAGKVEKAALDPMLLKTFAKVTLPSEAVMEGDINTILSARGIGKKWVGAAEGAANGGSLADDSERASYLEAIRAIRAKARENANKQAQRVVDSAKKNGVSGLRNPYEAQPSGESEFE